MKTKSTLTEIAEKAGVSIATVSRILNDTGRVSPATRQKVLQAIRELEEDFSLRSCAAFYQRILVLVPDFFNPFYANIIDGIQQTAHNNDYEIFVMPTKDSYPNPSYLVNMIKRENFSGVLWVCSTPPPELLQVVQNNCPIVMCCEYPEDLPCSFVSVDDISAGFRAVNYLLSTGRQKIGMINCSLKYKYARHRRQGYLQALSKAGLEFNPEWYVIALAVSLIPSSTLLSACIILLQRLRCNNVIKDAADGSTIVLILRPIGSILSHKGLTNSSISLP